MRGIRAKQIRKIIYGEKTFRARKHYANKVGSCVCDSMRQDYQRLKKHYYLGLTSLGGRHHGHQRASN
jgi:hypothetical protein